MKTFKIATYNVNSIRSRLHILLPWLKDNRPDVICLQETKVEDGIFPREPFDDIGYHCVFRGEKRYNGVAIASREKPKDVTFGLNDGEEPDESRLITAIYDGISVVNTYVPQGRELDSPQFTYKLQWFNRLAQYFSRRYTPDAPVIWCGDINVAPEAIDVHDPKRLLGHVCFNPQVWAALEEIKAWGFIDIFRLHHAGEAGQYTFYDYRVPATVERGLGWRIDHIFATLPLAATSIESVIDLAPRRQEKPSDHTVLWASFRVNSLTSSE